MEQDGFKLKVKRGSEKQIVMAAPSAEVATAMPIVPVATAKNDTAQIEEEVDEKFENSKNVVSPLVGIFHELEGDNAVKIGDKLKKCDVICSVEAMKLMNDIQMPEDGEITWIAVSEGDSVEYDQVIYRYI